MNLLFPLFFFAQSMKSIAMNINKADFTQAGSLSFYHYVRKEQYTKVSRNTPKRGYNDPLLGGHAH